MSGRPDSSPRSSASPAEASSSSSTPPGRRERRRDQTLAHLADTAWALFKAQGFEAVTMEAIAEAADVAKGTLYKHFPVKEALLRHRLQHELAQSMPALLAELGALSSAGARLRRFFVHSADWAIAHRDFLLPYVRFRLGELNQPQGADPSRRSGLDRVFAGLIAAGQAQGEFRAGFDASVLAQYLQSLHLVAMLRWLGTPGLDLHAEFERMLDLFLNGLGGARP